MEWFWKKYFAWRSRRLKPLDVVDFKAQMTGVQRVLIYLPNQIEKDRIEFILTRAPECLSECYVEYLIPHEFPSEWRNLLAGRNQSFHQMRKEDVGGMRTMKKNLIQILRDKRFDLALDFNYVLDYTIALAMRACEVPLIVGSIADKQAELFHNVLILARDARTYDERVFDCLSQLREKVVIV